MPAVRECWYCRYADFRKSTKLHIRSSICRCMENRVDTRFGFMKMKNDREEMIMTITTTKNNGCLTLGAGGTSGHHNSTGAGDCD